MFDSTDFPDTAAVVLVHTYDRSTLHWVLTIINHMYLHSTTGQPVMNGSLLISRLRVVRWEKMEEGTEKTEQAWKRL